VRRWQKSILHVRGDHCVEDCFLSSERRRWVCY